MATFSNQQPAPAPDLGARAANEAPMQSYQQFLQTFAPASAAPIDSTTPTSVGASGYGEQVGSAFRGAVDKFKQGGRDVTQSHGNPLDLVRGVGRLGSSLVEAAMSPLAPVTNKVGEALVAPGSLVDTLSNSPTVQKFSNTTVGKNVAGAAENVANYSEIAGTVGGFMEGPEAAVAVKNKAGELMSPGLPKPEEVPDIASSVLEKPKTPEEQQAAFRQGRTSMQKGKATIAPDYKNAAVQKTLEPLVQDGRISAPIDPLTGHITGEAQIANGRAVDVEINNIQHQIESGIAANNAPLKVEGSLGSDPLSGELRKVEAPATLKGNSQLANLQEKVLDNAIGVNTNLGLFHFRQWLDDMVNHDFPNIHEADGTALKTYYYALREKASDLLSKNLPEGKLADGTDFRVAMKNESNLIRALDTMSEKFTQEYPEGLGKAGQFAKAHPLISGVANPRFVARHFIYRGMSGF